MDSLRGRRISVIGAARSGLDAARVLTLLGAEVLLSDSQTAERLGVERAADAAATGARLALGADVETALPEGTASVITSPGVPATSPVLRAAVERHLPIWSEIELAYRLAEAPIVAVTGTNGKTTTTLLIAAMLRAANIDAFVAGNISADQVKRTLVSAAWESRSAPARSRVIVAEISSFQLEWVERFAPRVGVLTNVTPDHLNRHATFGEYARMKARLFAAQGTGDRAILNYDNPAAREIGQAGVPGRLCWFTSRPDPAGEGPASWLHQGEITVRIDGEPIPILAVDRMPPTLPGAHSVENALAASLAALAMGADAAAIRQALLGFAGVPHRMEWVTDVDGVRYINNSMCTNVAAGVSSLLALDRPAVVIAGGADKDLDFAPLASALRARAKTLILIGQAADKMEAALRGGGYDAIERADTLEAAVMRSRALTHAGEAVLLSPSCASFDMFTDFEARGDAFRHAVYALGGTER